MVCSAETILLSEPPVILQVKEYDWAKPLNSASFSAEIVNVETWDSVSESKIPSFTVYPSAITVVEEVQLTPVI